MIQRREPTQLAHGARMGVARIAMPLMVVCIGCSPPSRATNTPQLISTNPFAGFAIMPLPRQELPIGAHWQPGLGPLDKGLPAEQVVTTQSIEKFDSIEDRTLRDSVRARLAEVVSVAVGVTSVELSRISLRRASVVSVRDITDLQFVDGASYLWDAVRLNSFSLSRQTQDSTSIGAALKSAFPASSVDLVRSTGDQQLIEVTGADLFVAFRVVTLRRAQLDTIATDAWPPFTRGAGAIGSDYDIAFKSAPEPSAETESVVSGNDSCSALMTVTSHGELDATRRLKQQTWKACCWDSSGDHRADANGSFILSTAIAGSGAHVDVLNTELQDCNETADGRLYVTARFDIRRTTWTMKVDPDSAKAAGWSQ
jgi:hypothetical protein